MIKFAVDCAQGMKYLHHRVHLVQRDLKSHNLLINATMTLKICDFGLSKVRRLTVRTKPSEERSDELICRSHSSH